MKDSRRLKDYDDLPLVLDVRHIQGIMGMMLYHFSCHLIRKDLMYNQREIRRQLQWQKNKGNTTWISKSRP